MCALPVYGTLYMYEASQAITIDGVNQYHAIIGMSAGNNNNGVTSISSLTGSITNTADNVGVLRCTDAAHGLTTGNYVTLTGMGDSAHVGITRVTVIDTDTFDCDDIAYNSSSDTGNWSRGSGFSINHGCGGLFKVSFNISLYSAGNNKNYKFEIIKNANNYDEIAFKRMISVLNDVGVAGASGKVVLSEGDVIWIVAECTTDSTDLGIDIMNFDISRE